MASANNDVSIKASVRFMRKLHSQPSIKWALVSIEIRPSGDVTRLKEHRRELLFLMTQFTVNLYEHVDMFLYVVDRFDSCVVSEFIVYNKATTHLRRLRYMYTWDRNAGICGVSRRTYSLPQPSLQHIIVVSLRN
jgi:hypothetical protein